MLRLFLTLVLAVAAGCTAGSGSDSEAPAAPTAAPVPHYVGADGVEIKVPGGWYETYTEAGAITDPVVRLAVSSGPIRPQPNGCQVSAYDFPEDAVAVVVLEWTTTELPRATGATPRPQRFTAVSLPVREPPAIECFAGSGGSAQFVEAGRVFGAYVLLGRQAPAALADKARAVLDTLLIDMRVPRPVKLVALAKKRVAHCQRSALLRTICPTRVPSVRAPYLSHLSRELLGPAGSLDVFDLERGAGDPERPERNRPPRMVWGAKNRVPPANPHFSGTRTEF